MNDSITGGNFTFWIDDSSATPEEVQEYCSKDTIDTSRNKDNYGELIDTIWGLLVAILVAYLFKKLRGD